MCVVATMMLSGLVLSGRNKASHPVLQKSSSSFRRTLYVQAQIRAPLYGQQFDNITRLHIPYWQQFHFISTGKTLLGHRMNSTWSFSVHIHPRYTFGGIPPFSEQGAG